MTDRVAEVVALTKRVDALSSQSKELLLYGLVGRMVVENPEGLRDDIDQVTESHRKLERTLYLQHQADYEWEKAHGGHQ